MPLNLVEPSNQLDSSSSLQILHFFSVGLSIWAVSSLPAPQPHDSTSILSPSVKCQFHLPHVWILLQSEYCCSLYNILDCFENCYTCKTKSSLKIYKTKSSVTFTKQSHQLHLQNKVISYIYKTRTKSSITLAKQSHQLYLQVISYICKSKLAVTFTKQSHQLAHRGSPPTPTPHSLHYSRWQGVLNYRSENQKALLVALLSILFFLTTLHRYDFQCPSLTFLTKIGVTPLPTPRVIIPRRIRRKKIKIHM